MSVDVLNKHLQEILEGTSVHCGIEEALSNIPFEYWGKRVRRIPYTLFELLEHIRLSNRDILEYMTNKDYQAGEWPEVYWPKHKKPKNPEEVEISVKALHSDLKEIRKILKWKPSLEPLPHGNKHHTPAREVMILSNHTAYHLGQFILLRRLLGIWD